MTTKETGEHRDIMGIRVAAFGWTQALERLEQSVDDEGAPHVVNFLNAHNANLAMRDPNYREGLAKCEVLPDGLGVDIASRTFYGTSFPANLNGTDLVPALLVYIQRPLKVALIGGRPDILKVAAERFASATPWHTFHAVSDGYFDRSNSAAILDQLAAIDPDITLVALGSPTQEVWIDTHIRQGHGRLVMGVGALFDFVSGAVPRAPQAFRTLRVEWLWRLILEPSRLWRRYIVGNPVFLWHVLRYKLMSASRNSRIPV
ncbi:WecB/TagA/CpsF family glycosyltransferase [Hoeflea sp. G2-23]|uniref:WecB/TagA/CpsF family glycosyltransferase n=1 Tax=Hoeflea algicola TaxID=2983763 RepID=A0ABT3ZDT4_9HYPH|nr:WecB/TagA/CpsF family glycosyltransferase [Hoeflea algicola]MCY0149951.1 WecB/TagA/CpsF family glycosyltransferase [Hoeflea algicola]